MGGQLAAFRAHESSNSECEYGEAGRLLLGTLPASAVPSVPDQGASMARVDVNPEDRGTEPGLTLTQIRECPECDTDVEVYFFAPGVEDMEDIEEPDQLKASVPCPSCEVVTEYTYNGWTVHGDAG